MTGCWQHYHRPDSVNEAVELLQHYDGRGRVVGGGTDLLVEIRRGLRRPEHALVDASRLDGLDRIDQHDGYVVIGCGVTHTQIVSDENIARYGTCLAESCSVIGGPQVRNVGTLAGNVAHALPAGDGTIGLLALDGEVEVTGSDGARWMPLQETFVAPGRSVIDRHREVLSRMRFKPTGAREASAHHRVMRPQGLCLPIISIAVRLKLADDGSISRVRIGLGPVGPVPFVAEAAMAALVDGPATMERFARAAQVALDSVSLRASKYRASYEYRADMLRTCLPMLLQRAAQRAAGDRA